MVAVPSARAWALRVLRLRCPACGRGRVFRRGFERARRCASCGWALDRDEGHWLGGAEVHMFGTYGGSALAVLPLVLFADLSALGVNLLVAGHLLLSVGTYRHSRALFLALDFLLDPVDTPPPGDRRRRLPADDPRPPVLPPRRPGGAAPRRPRKPSPPAAGSVKMVGCAAPSTPGPSIPSPSATSTSSRGGGGSSPR